MKLLLVALTALVAFATVDCHSLPASEEDVLYEDMQYFLDNIPSEKVIEFESYALYQNELSKDIHEFIALLDMNKIMGILAAHLQDDQVKKALGYLQSEEFHVLVRKVEAMKEYQDLVLYLHDAGLDIFNLIQKIHKFFGMEDYVPPHHGQFEAYNVRVNLGGIKGMVDEIIATLPKDKIKALYEYKMKNSPAFKKFIDRLRSPDFKKIVDLVYHTPIFIEMREKAIEAGLDLAPVRELIKQVLGLDLHVPQLSTYAQNELSKDIHEFIALLDMNKIMGILAAHLQDDQVKKALGYLQSEEFHVLVRKVEAMKEYQDLVLYLHDAGLDIFNLIQKIHKFFGMEDYVPPHHGQFEAYNVRVNLGGIKGMVDEIIATLPKDKIKALYEYKMKNSPAFKKFIDRLRSPDFKKIVDLVYHTPIFIEMREKAIEAGLDLAPVRELIKQVLGLDLHVPQLSTYAQNELSKDIHEFIALLDMNKIMGILAAHLQDDQVKKALGYLQSEEFHVLVRKVEAMKEYQDLVLYLHDAGLDIFNLIQKIHKFFGMEDYVPPHHGQFEAYNVRVNLGGIKGMVDEIIATLPKDKIKALYEYKMKNSPAFKKFIDRLRSPDFKKIVDLVYHTPIFIEMREKAIEAGLDLAPVRELIKQVLGLDLHVPAYF